MPRSGWLALGAIGAALVLVDGPLATAGSRGAVIVALVSLAAAASMALAGHLDTRLRVRRHVAGGLVVGAVLLAARVAANGATPAAAPSPPTGTGPWSASVLSIGPLRASTRPAVLDLVDPPGIRVAASLPAWPTVVPGDLIAVGGTIEPPGDDEYGDYLRKLGASGTLRARSVEVAAPTDDLGRRLEGWRRAADEALQRSIPEPEAGLASGILIGLRDRVDRDLTAAFTAVGASHVVAISGWNIAIVATTLGALTGRVARRRRAALTAFAIVAYVVFVGASPSVVRAALMAAVVLVARELGRPSRAAAAIAWAVLLLLLVDPRLIDDVGFRLSALATAGLIAWGTPLSDRLAGPAPGRVRAWLAESLGVSLAAQLATLPIVALEFGRLSLVSPLVNLGVVPLVAPAMAAGALALLAGMATFGGVVPIVATIGGLPAWTMLAAIVGMVRAGAAVPFASLDLPAPWDIAVAGLAAIAIVVFDRRIRGRRPETVRAAVAPSLAARRPAGSGRRVPAIPRPLAIALAGSIVALAIAVVHRPTGVATLTMLDVGQGDAILLEGDRGNRLLIDGGPDPGRLLVALDEHLPPWDRRIDIIVLSHPHEDHAAGLAALLSRYRVKRAFEPGMIGPGPGYAALNAALEAGGIRRGILATGDRLAVDDIRLQVLWPDQGSVPQEPPDGGTGINNVSIVFLGEVGRHRFLLGGDIEEEIDPTLLARGMPRVEVLKVAHHGSRTSSTEPFLEALRPAVAVVSSGKGNPYGHPAPATIGRLEAIGAQVYRTDTNGIVTVELGPGPIHVRAARGAPSSASAPREGPTGSGPTDPGPPDAGPTGAGPTGAASVPRFGGGVAVNPRGSPAPALLCGLVPPSAAIARPPLGWVAGAGAGGLRPQSVALASATTVVLAPRIAGMTAALAVTPGPLRYHSSGDDRDRCPRPNPLRLGRRRVRPRRRGGGPPDRPAPLP
ncbi:MAG: ComEC/Rec2 family competence protein, partial [Candidatus Limnocylindrales bacterium]